ncbi:hypothetical protein QRX50_39040 [Amycolatopsis carbonis]|uniref:Secreted protein n=1 Tax=Amycolatopsis carbonis TaxID=715471 RepID=A0A9Y2ID63_9PSEU|nr:hypothetical protein [Amycolatopsis sp. 2-15]WIX77344.1 hypothetical protein QRX50_39040 [Amycolatopsis sp. 2-15]
MRRFLTAGLLAGSFALVTVVVPATASADAPPGWCLGPAPCTRTTDGWCLGQSPCTATTDGWCLNPSEDVCRRY